MGFFDSLWRRTTVSTGLPRIWDVNIIQSLYCEIQMRAIYSRIISDVLARSHKIPDEFRPLLRDSMEGNGRKGLTEHIVEAMASQKQIILKYEAGMIYVPEYGKREEIVKEWKAGRKPKFTLMMTFENYFKSTMLRQYLAHKYLLLCTQHKALNLSSAIQIKINDLRASVGLSESSGAKEQAKEIAEHLLEGLPTVTDAKDMIALLVPDTKPLESVAADVKEEISLILGLPISWVTGHQKVGLGDSGDADARSIERGLEPYFWESIHPAFNALFDVKLKFKSENHENISQALEAVKTFELVSDDLVSKDNQRMVVSKLLNIEPDGTEGNERDSLQSEQALEGNSAAEKNKAPLEQKSDA